MPDVAVKKRHKGHAARLGIDTILDYDSINDYRRRRAERLASRGIKTEKQYRRSADAEKIKEAEIKKNLSHMDAPDGEEEPEQNKYQARRGQSRGGDTGGGSHGNTKLPFGLCKRFGIEIGKDWGPKDAWDALAGKGITAEGAYERLKRGEDPGMPDNPVEGEKEPEKPKEPKKTFTDSKGREIEDVELKHYSWSSYDPWRITGTVSGSDGDRVYVRFATRGDMMWYLKEAGIEEIQDPETGEILNPKEMELPEKLFKAHDWESKWYTAVSIGLRKGKYAIVGTDMDGKKSTITDFGSLERAKTYLSERGVPEDKIKLSPAMKKREKERVAWLTSDKKEYIEKDGVRYGDIRVKGDGYGRFELTASDENGNTIYGHYRGKTQLMKYLKDQGVERAKIDDEFVNPQEYEMPKTVASISGYDYQKMYFKQDYSGSISLYGKDLDGIERRVMSPEPRETFEHFKDRTIRSLKIDESIIDVDDDTKKKIDEKIKEDQETARRRAEFEAKAVPFRGAKYADIALEQDSDGDIYFTGYDMDGKKRRISTYYSEMYDADELASREGLDINSVKMSDSLKQKYDKYKEARASFDKKAIEIDGAKFADVYITAYDDTFMVGGYDAKGRRREIDRGDYEHIKETLSKSGQSIENIPMDERAKDFYDFVQLEDKGIASGEFKRMSDGRAYKDLVIEPAYGGKFMVKGASVLGESKVFDTLSYDDAIDYLESQGITDYKFYDELNGQYITRPTGGIRKVRLMRTPSGEYKVMATVDKDTVKEVYSTSNEEDARNWLYGRGIDASKVKTKGMNPNDDVPRTHTARSLANFDKHRSEHEDDYKVLANMSDAEKKEVVDMMTDVFKNGQFRMRRSGHFEEIVEEGFKNTLETGTSGGATGERTRRYTEEHMLGVTGHTAEEGEKYGYVGHGDDAEAYQSRIAMGYGDVLYKFKKSAIGDRVTYTAGDSLDSYPEGADRPLAGYAGDHPTYEGVSAMRESRLKSVLADYRDYKSGRISFSDFLSSFSSNCPDGYIECHYHDKLTIADVESITTNKSKLHSIFEWMSEEKRKSILKKLKDNGIILQVCNRGSKTLEDGYEYLREEFGLE